MPGSPLTDQPEVPEEWDRLPVEQIWLTEFEEPSPAAGRIPWAKPTPAEESSAVLGQLHRTIGDLHAVIRQREAAHQATRLAHREILFRLAAAAEYKDDDTGIHLVRMGALSAMMAAELGMSSEFCELLAVAAPMHDVGKIGIPDHILKKPGPLTPDERATMQEHPLIGARLLGDSEVAELVLAAEIAHSHHERFDGKGYPKGLQGDDISLASRVVGLVDCYDAMTMARCYRPAMDEDVVAGMIVEGSGKHFDPDVVRIFQRLHPGLQAAKTRISELVDQKGAMEVLRDSTLWQRL